MRAKAGLVVVICVVAALIGLMVVAIVAESKIATILASVLFGVIGFEFYQMLRISSKAVKQEKRGF